MLTDSDSRLQTLAKAFKVDRGKLAQQLNEHKRLALAELGKCPQEPAMEAWRRALRTTQSDSRRRRQFPAQELLPALSCCLIAPGNTCGIERDFSKAERLLGKQWNGSPLAEERLMTIAAAAMTPELIANARLLWAACLGKPRAAGSSRARHLGLSLKALAAKRAKLSKTSESAWLRRRRARQCDADGADATSSGPCKRRRCQVDAAKPMSAGVVAAAEAAWSDGHMKEMAWQKKQQELRLSEAILEGTMDVSALGDDKMNEYKQKFAKHDLNLK